MRELTDEALKKIAHELTESLHKNLTVAWSERESVRAKLRLMVKRILRKYKYPPNQQESAVEWVLQLAKALGVSGNPIIPTSFRSAGLSSRTGGARLYIVRSEPRQLGQSRHPSITHREPSGATAFRIKCLVRQDRWAGARSAADRSSAGGAVQRVPGGRRQCCRHPPPSAHASYNGRSLSLEHTLPTLNRPSPV